MSVFAYASTPISSPARTERAQAIPSPMLIDLQWFAAEDEGRTEEASDYKLRKAREEGRVAKSQEINGALVLLLPVICLVICAPWMMSVCLQTLQFYILRSTTTAVTDPALLAAFFSAFLRLILPVALTALVSGVAGNIIQNRGFIFSVKPITPKFSKVLPRFGQYFQRTLFSFEGIFNVFKSIFKVLILAFVAFLVIRSHLPTLLTLLNSNLWQAICYIAQCAAQLLIIAAVIFLAIAIPDYVVQRR